MTSPHIPGAARSDSMALRTQTPTVSALVQARHHYGQFNPFSLRRKTSKASNCLIDRIILVFLQVNFLGRSRYLLGIRNFISEPFNSFKWNHRSRPPNWDTNSLSPRWIRPIIATFCEYAAAIGDENVLNSYSDYSCASRSSFLLGRYNFPITGFVAGYEQTDDASIVGQKNNYL